MAMRLTPLLLFMTLLLLPLFAQLTGLPRVAPLEEYRKLAEWPHSKAYFADGKADFLGYTAKLNTWHLDNFATRAFWVRLRTQLLFSLFRESDQVHVGPDNWLFYRSVVDRETPAIEQISRDARRASVARIERLSKLLEQRGIQLHVMPLALKHRYYPEFLPASASHALRFRYYDQFMDDLIANGGVRVVDSRKPLQEAKRDGLRIFHKTDFHWTDPAGARVFRELLRRIADAEGQSTLPDTWRYEVVEREVIGGQGRAMPLLRSPREQSIALALQAPLTRFENNTGSSEFLWSATAAPGQGPLLPPMLVWGDSFLDAGVRAGFFNFFSAISRGRIYQMSLVNAYQQRHPGTRHLLIEWITSATVAVDNEVAALVAALEAESPAAPGP